MWEGAKLWMLTVFFILLIGFTIGGISLVLTGTFLPWQERVRRSTFEQSQSYVQGKISQLNKLRLDYVDADSTHRCALRSMALHEAALATELPADLTSWVHELEENNTCTRN